MIPRRSPLSWGRRARRFRPLPEQGPTSIRSARVTAIRRLANRSFRQKVGRFLAEGPQVVREAVRCRPDVVDEVLIVDDMSDGGPARRVAVEAEDAGLRVTWVEPRVLLAMTETVHPQGVAAVCSYLDRPAGEILRESRPAVLLDRVADPGNAGTILRTADAAGAHGVIFSAGSVDPYNGKCVRSSAGSLFHVPLAAGADPLECIGLAQERGTTVLATTPRGEVSLFDPPVREALRGRVMWVFGSEAHGVGDEPCARADLRVAIPMPGRAESLNLAVAAALCLYAGVREQAVG